MRQGNRPDRRFVPERTYDNTRLAAIKASARYTGSGHHKLRPGDYGFDPPVSPRPSKSVCDDLRPVLRDEATMRFGAGIDLCMIGVVGPDNLPKYVWTVDGDGEVYEAKASGSDPGAYHGYRLNENDAMRKIVSKEWTRRCRPT